jgi:hypothetical protein
LLITSPSSPRRLLHFLYEIAIFIDDVNVKIENMSLTRTTIQRNFAPQTINQKTLTAS